MDLDIASSLVESLSSSKRDAPKFDDIYSAFVVAASGYDGFSFAINTYSNLADKLNEHNNPSLDSELGLTLCYRPYYWVYHGGSKRFKGINRFLHTLAAEDQPPPRELWRSVATAISASGLDQILAPKPSNVTIKPLVGMTFLDPNKREREDMFNVSSMVNDSEVHADFVLAIRSIVDS